jgi:hypothetical protein
VKLPAPLVKAWADLQLNFDAVGRSGAAGVVIGGPWSASGPPSRSTGQLLRVGRAGAGLLLASATGYVTAPGNLAIEVYFDGAMVSTMFLGGSFASNDRRPLPAVFVPVNVAAGDHYLWLRQTAGTSDVIDRASVALITP